MIKRIFSVFIAGTLVVSAGAQISWPAITQTAKPWTRWWWEGSAVNERDLSWNLETYRQAGLGGVEITPIYGIHGYESRFVDFLTPKWMQLLQHTLNESRRLGMGVDLANATGWPFGGPWIGDDNASKSVYYKTYQLAGGEKLSGKIEYRQEAMVRTANNKPASIDTIKKPVYANKNLQDLALDQIQYPGKLPLQCLMAYGENKAMIDLTRSVDPEGNLNWTAPPGNWTLYALFIGLHGKMVERGAPGGEGYAIDHFSAQAANTYFKKFDEAFAGYDLSYLRGYFNDSYEVDDARGQANWTEHMLDEFEKRKGYDLRNELPALFGKDSKEKNSRVLYDYRSVIDELILEDFTWQWKKWADKQGKIVRNQSHGSPANTLDLYSVVDIPETEGNDILRFKFATSAANVTGKKLVSSESATWLNEHFLSSWGDVKKAIDLYFLGGVNHIFYHGTAYSPKDVPWPGWLFYAAVHFQPTNPQWKDFHALNTYITRVQSFLQQGKPDNDILLYYPIADRYSEPGNTMLQHFDGMERNFERTDFEHVSKWMLEQGYSFDFFSDRQLQTFSVKEKKVVTGGSAYSCILLPANKLVPASTMEKLIALAEQGATILFYKELPADIPGYASLEVERARLKSSKDRLQFKGLSYGIRIAKTPGGGQVAYSSELKDLFYQFGIRQESMSEKGLQFIRRKTGDDLIYFISNTGTKLFNEWIHIQSDASSVIQYDPYTGKAGLSKIYHKDETSTEVRLQLMPGESCILVVSPSAVSGKNMEYFTEDESSRTVIKSSWNLRFTEGGPSLPVGLTLQDGPADWTTLGDKNTTGKFSGTGVYSTTFKCPKGKADGYRLNLGVVKETAKIVLNGDTIATLIGPGFWLDIPKNKMKKNNKLDVVVSNLMANRIIDMDKKGEPWKIFYNTNMPARRRENVKDGLFSAAGWSPLPSGLLGPVTLTKLFYEK